MKMKLKNLKWRLQGYGYNGKVRKGPETRLVEAVFADCNFMKIKFPTKEMFGCMFLIVQDGKWSIDQSFTEAVKKLDTAPEFKSHYKTFLSGVYSLYNLVQDELIVGSPSTLINRTPGTGGKGDQWAVCIYYRA